MLKNVLRKLDNATIRLIGVGQSKFYNYELPEIDSEKEMRKALIKKYFEYQPPLWRIFLFRVYVATKRIIFRAIRKLFGLLSKVAKGAR